MRRYQGRRFDGFEREYPMQPSAPIQPPNLLDPKEERLIEAHLEIGRLQQANDLIVEDNSRLEDENAKLREENKDLRRSNDSYRETAARERGASDLVD
ncbi:MAG TPA: hypothetical protein VN081_00955, partial [Dongiaceae bacterium]|nr:hypothetical protein [Dongiaceae bacterium]